MQFTSGPSDDGICVVSPGNDFGKRQIGSETVFKDFPRCHNSGDLSDHKKIEAGNTSASIFRANGDSVALDVICTDQTWKERSTGMSCCKCILRSCSITEEWGNKLYEA